MPITDKSSKDEDELRTEGSSLSILTSQDLDDSKRNGDPPSRIIHFDKSLSKSEPLRLPCNPSYHLPPNCFQERLFSSNSKGVRCPSPAILVISGRRKDLQVLPSHFINPEHLIEFFIRSDSLSVLSHFAQLIGLVLMHSPGISHDSRRSSLVIELLSIDNVRVRASQD